MRHLLTAIFLLISTAAHALHGPENKVGDQLVLVAWCKNPVHAVRAVNYMQQDPKDKYIDYMLSADNTCMDIRAARLVDAYVFSKEVIVLRIFARYEVNDDLSVEISECADTSGNKYYSWHFIIEPKT